MANFAEDSRFTNWITRMGVQFTYREGLRFDELAPDWNTINQGRPDSTPKEETLIEKYAAAMEQGAIFPAPIIAMQVDGSFEVLDGCQRLNAATICGQTLFNAYIIKSDNPSVRASIRICANSVLNGSPPSQEWTIGKIVDVLYEQFRYSAVDCANWSGQPVQKIQDEIDARDVARWLRTFSVDTTVKPANQKAFRVALSNLSPIVTRQHITKELPICVKALQAVKANNDEAVHLLTECFNFKPIHGVAYNQQFQKKVDEVMSRPEIRARMSGSRTMHPVDNVMRSLASTVTTMRKCAKEKYHADQSQATQILELLGEAQALAKQIVPQHLWPEVVVK